MAAVDWTQGVSYRELVAEPQVRAMIESAASHSRRGMSAEEFLEAASPLVQAAVGGASIPLKLIAEIAPPLATRFGIQTGKSEGRRVALPPGRAIVGCLCSLASRGQTLTAAHQGQDGVVLEAKLPSDMRASEGLLRVALRRDGEGTLVQASTRVPQMVDWGKSTQVLETLFVDISNFATLQP